MVRFGELFLTAAGLINFPMSYICGSFVQKRKISSFGLKFKDVKENHFVPFGAGGQTIKQIYLVPVWTGG